MSRIYSERRSCEAHRTATKIQFLQ